jgi:Reverse transcriptase (RNA-dependent DNA polymerase)
MPRRDRGCHFGIFLPSVNRGSSADTPSFHQALSSHYREDFLEAMEKEIQELEAHGTWSIVKRSSLPEGAKVLPSTWAFKVKRYPDGRYRKCKARFCVRGDMQIEQVDYFESWSPVVAWSTVRLTLTLAISQGWESRQIDFSNAFVQSRIDDDIYIRVPPMFEPDENQGDQDVVMKLNKSLYGLVQAPYLWFNRCSEALGKVGLITKNNIVGGFGHNIVRSFAKMVKES